MNFTAQQALARVIDHREIFHDEMIALMRAIMRGEVSPVLTASILAGLRVKKETVGEIAAAARVMREFARAVPLADREHFLDIVGTGGDGAHTFNISTASMFVAAGAGARVANHGNRSGSSASGSADVIVDITSTGSTLTANHLKVLDDGIILRSEACLVTALRERSTGDQAALDALTERFSG